MSHLCWCISWVWSLTILQCQPARSWYHRAGDTTAHWGAHSFATASWQQRWSKHPQTSDPGTGSALHTSNQESCYWCFFLRISNVVPTWLWKSWWAKAGKILMGKIAETSSRGNVPSWVTHFAFLVRFLKIVQLLGLLVSSLRFPQKMPKTSLLWRVKPSNYTTRVVHGRFADLHWYNKAQQSISSLQIKWFKEMYNGWYGIQQRIS